MSGYFDALMRSSGMTIGRSEPALTPPEPAAIEGEVDGSTTSAEANAVRSASTPHEPHAPPDTADAIESPMPPRLLASVDRHKDQEPATAPTRAHSAAEERVDSPKKPSAPPVESRTPDVGHTLVRAAMRWVVAGTPQDSAVTDFAQGVPRPPQSSPVVHEQDSTIATTRLDRDDDDALSESPNGARAAPAPLNVPAKESVAAAPLPIRASLVAPASLPPVVPPVRDEVVEVSIGAIHVRVDAPPAQTIARPALTPAAGKPSAATTSPVRSALSRRALRRI